MLMAELDEGIMLVRDSIRFTAGFYLGVCQTFAFLEEVVIALQKD